MELPVEMIPRVLIAPETVRAWLALTLIWMGMAFSTGLLAGLTLERPNDGLSAGIFLSGLCLTYAMDQLSLSGSR